MTEVQDESAPHAGLVTRLLSEQFPTLADRPVRPSQASGSSNWVFRVGDDHAVRLPRSDSYIADLMTEAEFLPLLAPHLGVRVPEVRFVAEPSIHFPRPWTIVTWLTGEAPVDLAPPGQARLATALGQFIRRLHAVETAGLEHGADRWGYRAGEPVTDVIDGWVDRAARLVVDLFDPGQVREAWSRLRDVPPAPQPPCWVHTDLSVENLLASADGDLVGVLDFGGLGVGDASVDLLYAWAMFDAPARDVLFSEVGADDATRRRARAWAFAGPGLLSIAHFRQSMPARTVTLTKMVETVAGEVGVALR